MTTAHRPTYRPAIGGSEQGGNKMLVHSRSYHSKDLPAYLILKMRLPGQGTQEELNQKDFKADLIKREGEGRRQRELKALGVSETSLAIEATQQNQNKDVQEPIIIKKTKIEEKQVYPQDADDKDFIKSSDDEQDVAINRQQVDRNQGGNDAQVRVLKEEESESSSSSSEEDDDELLMKEYQKIKEFREQEEKKRILQKQEYLDQNREDEIIKGNPLLISEDYSLKKKWHEDTIFKNQSRLEVKEKQRFINDAVRSDFHKKFINKYIQM